MLFLGDSWHTERQNVKVALQDHQNKLLFKNHD